MRQFATLYFRMQLRSTPERLGVGIDRLLAVLFAAAVTSATEPRAASASTMDGVLLDHELRGVPRSVRGGMRAAWYVRLLHDEAYLHFV